MTNPYNLAFVKGLLGQQETARLEFKSSRGLLNENQQKREKFISDQLVPTVSAFLNTDGGQLVIGIEDKDGVAVSLSEGVPRGHLTWERLQQAICDRISPAVAGYVSVFSVPIEKTEEGEDRFAFVVDVKPGTTAYQADDKRYYVRRSGQSVAMEDKDVRLRMLAGDKPRLTINLHKRMVPHDAFPSHVGNVTWDLSFKNVGIRSISRAIVKTNLIIQGLTDSCLKLLSHRTPEYRQTDFPFEGLKASGLLPGRSFDLQHVWVDSMVFALCEDPFAVTMMVDVIAYIDDGLPAELRNYNLMADLQPVIEKKWKLATD